MWQLLWVFLPVVAHADMNDCVREPNQDKKTTAWPHIAAVVHSVTRYRTLAIEHSACEW